MDAREIVATLRAMLTAAVKGHDADTVAAARSALAAIANAEAVALNPADTPSDMAQGKIAGASLGAGSTEVPRRELSRKDVIEVIRREITERESAVLIFESGGRAGRAKALRREIDALVEVLRRAL